MSAAVKAPPVHTSANGTRSSVEEINPQTAQAWLDKYNENNFRVLSQATVDKYAALMEAGLFGLSSSCITLCTDPVTGEVTLGDGQHRLAACVQANVTITQTVVYGADPADVVHADRGKSRKLADYLRHQKRPHPTVLSPTLRILHTFKWGDRDRMSRPYAEDHELLKLDRNRPDVAVAVEWAVKVTTGRNRAVPMPPAWAAAARVLIMESTARLKGEEGEQAVRDADFFFRCLVTGERPNELINEKHPIVQMYCMLQRRGNMVKGNLQLPNHVLFAMILKSWNMFREGDLYTTLTFKAGGANPEPYPEPR